MNNNNIKRIILVIGVLAAFCTVIWWFTDIIVYIFLSLFLAIIGSPLVRLLRKVKIGKFQINDSVAAGITLVVIFAVFSSAFSLLMPLISYEVHQIQSIDLELIINNFSTLCTDAEQWLRHKHLITKDFDLNQIIYDKTGDFISRLHFSTLFGNVISTVGTIFICLFSVMFMTFFALKDNSIFWTTIKKLIPYSLRDNFDNILVETKKQLRRYFIGVFLEMIIVGVLDGLLCFVLGVPNALLIGVIGGLLNIIPYVGPLIACAASVAIGLSSTLIAGDAAITTIIIKVISSFIAVKMIDDFVLQPNIYGKSVNAHPLEIFIVILIAGKVGGVWGMMFGVPAYTLIRIVIKEFFAQYFNPTPAEVPTTDPPAPSEPEKNEL